MESSILDKINNIYDLKKIPRSELASLSEEIRAKIIDVVSRNGGHLASNLGVVELTIALHYVFDQNKDRIIFDVGHQSYTHKILTERKDQFDTLRLAGGISGFTRRGESKYDYTDSGHASTSISIAAGFAMSDKLQNKDNHTVVVIGDGSIGGGVALEGLNFVGTQELPLLVVLNDNDMSISKNVGAISKHIAGLTMSRFYQWLTDKYYQAMNRKPGLIKFLFWFAKKFEKGLRIFGGYENIFSDLGFQYIGPIDGHDTAELIRIFCKIKKNVQRPVLLHIKTVKGKGFAPAENNPTYFHGVSPWIINQEHSTDSQSNATIIDGKVEHQNKSRTFTDVFSDIMLELAEKHQEVTAVTAAMCDGTGLSAFAQKYPTRFFDVGIAEQHAVSFCSGLANSGLTPIFAVYSTFFTRAIDEVIQDVCISKAPVIFALDRSGVVGQDGETHHGQFDISLLNAVPDITILAPADETEMRLAFDYAYRLHSPVAIRYPKGRCIYDSFLTEHEPYSEENALVRLKSAQDKAIVVIGPFVNLAVQAIGDSEVGLYVLRQIKPLPTKRIVEELSRYKKIILIEDGSYNGGGSESVVNALNGHSITFHCITLPDRFITHGSRESLLDEFGFNAENLKKLLD